MGTVKEVEDYLNARANKESAAKDETRAGPPTPRRDALGEYSETPPGHPRFFSATDAQRKLMPVASGFIRYFPDAMAAAAYVSYLGNEKHNPGQPLHWSQDKSKDHLDCCGRHLAGVGTLDTDGVPHSWRLLWRAAALVQMELQAEGAPIPAGAKLPER